MNVAILHTNDFHGTLTEAKANFIHGLKANLGQALYFDTGDCIKTGNLGVPLKREKAWELLALAGCDASVLGNRETHVLAPAFKAKIEGHQNPILCANLRLKDGSKPLPSHLWFEHEGLKIAVFGVMVPMVTERMTTKAASAFLWDSPIAVARQQAEELRKDSDILIALTHIGLKQDLELAHKCSEIDIILSGHSHTVLQEPTRIGDTFICQGGSHGRYIGNYIFRGRGQFGGCLIPLP